MTAACHAPSSAMSHPGVPHNRNERAEHPNWNKATKHGVWEKAAAFKQRKARS